MEAADREEQANGLLAAKHRRSQRSFQPADSNLTESVVSDVYGQSPESQQSLNDNYGARVCLCMLCVSSGRGSVSSCRRGVRR